MKKLVIGTLAALTLTLTACTATTEPVVDAVTATETLPSAQQPAIEPTEFEGVYIINKSYIADDRGATMAVYNKQLFDAYGIDFALNDLVFTAHNKDVIRGIHFQESPEPQEKLVGVVQGSIKDIIVDLRPESSTFKQVMEIELSADENKLVYIPEGFGHGMVSLEDNTLTFFAVSGAYNQELNKGIKWDSIDYNWGVAEPIVSEADESWPTLDEYVATLQ